MINGLCSIILRTKNEERWISSCLKAISRQTYIKYEVIIVDNCSTDKTIEKAKKYSINKIVNIENYLPGESLNAGIRESKGEYIVCLSAHCIPTNEFWLERMVSAIEEDESYAGVYGRQEPMSFSSPSDKRDLLLVFGLDRKYQNEDSFFHNANSILRKKLWDEIPFDSKITNIEDRIWAQEMLNRGHKILYEPKASVYHYHGIHQNGNEERLRNIVKIIEDRNPETRPGKLNPDELNIVAIIPIRGTSRIINNKSLIVYTIESALESKYIDKVIVSTDSQDTQNIAISAGAECPFLRPLSLSESHVNHEAVQKYTLEKIESTGYFPDLIFHLEETFPFRPPGLIDEMIEHLLNDGFDTVIAARRETGYLWQEDERGGYKQIDSGDVPRKYKEQTLVGIHGLGMITHSEFIRRGSMVGGNIGLYRIDDSLASLEIRNNLNAKIPAIIFKEIEENQKEAALGLQGRTTL